MIILVNILKLSTILICSIVRKDLTSKIHMKTFLHIFKRILAERYPDLDFEFYLSSRSKNLHMGLNCNILSLSEYVNIISDIKRIWNEKRQDHNFVFVMPYLIHTTMIIFALKN